MNKKSIILVVGVLCIIIVSVTLLLFKENEVIEPQEENTIKYSLSETIKIKTKTIRNENSKKSINIEYPEFQNLDDNFERYINSKIYNEINENNIYKNNTEGYESGEVGFFTYETNYDRYNCSDFVSIVVNQYIHLGDGRPQFRKECYVIDAKNNYTATLTDIFAKKINYKTSIINEINKQAKDMDIELVGGNGLKAISDTQKFYIKDKKLVIYFEASEIAAAAVGELEFVMPFEMIENKFVI